MSIKEAWDEAGEEPRAAQAKGWNELYLKEDWWAIWLALGIVAVALGAFAGGGSIKAIAVSPPPPVLLTT